MLKIANDRCFSTLSHSLYHLIWKATYGVLLHQYVTDCLQTAGHNSVQWKPLLSNEVLDTFQIGFWHGLSCTHDAVQPSVAGTHGGEEEGWREQVKRFSVSPPSLCSPTGQSTLIDDEYWERGYRVRTKTSPKLNYRLNAVRYNILLLPKQHGKDLAIYFYLKNCVCGKTLAELIKLTKWNHFVIICKLNKPKYLMTKSHFLFFLSYSHFSYNNILFFLKG